MRAIHHLIPMLTAELWGVPHVRAPQQPSASATELSIIAAAIDSLYMRGEAARVVFSPTAELRSDILRGELVGRSAPRETADDTAGRNAMSVDIRGFVRFVTSRIPVAFIDSGSLPASPSDPDVFWKAFFAAYPGTKRIVTVSRPGVSADGQHAVIRIGMGCGARRGSCGLARLQRIGERWHVRQFIIDRSS